MYMLKHEDNEVHVRVSGWVFWPSVIASTAGPLAYIAWGIWVLVLNGLAAEHYLGLTLWISLPVLASLMIRTNKFHTLPKYPRIVVSLTLLAVAMWYQVDVNLYSLVGLVLFALPPVLLPLFMKTQKAWHKFLREHQALQPTKPAERR